MEPWSYQFISSWEGLSFYFITLLIHSSVLLYSLFQSILVVMLVLVFHTCSSNSSSVPYILCTNLVFNPLTNFPGILGLELAGIGGVWLASYDKLCILCHKFQSFLRRPFPGMFHLLSHLFPPLGCFNVYWLRIEVMTRVNCFCSTIDRELLWVWLPSPCQTLLRWLTLLLFSVLFHI